MTYSQNFDADGFDLPHSWELLDKLVDWASSKDLLQKDATSYDARQVRRYLKGDQDNRREGWEQILREVSATLLQSDDDLPEVLQDRLEPIEKDPLESGLEHAARFWDSLVSDLYNMAYRLDDPGLRLLPFLRLAVLDAGVRWGALHVLLQGDVLDEEAELPPWMRAQGFKEVMDHYRESTLGELVEPKANGAQLVSRTTLDNWRAGRSRPNSNNLEKLAYRLAMPSDENPTLVEAHLRLALGFEEARDHVEETISEERLDDLLDCLREMAHHVSTILVDSDAIDDELRSLVFKGAQGHGGPFLCRTIAREVDHTYVRDDLRALAEGKWPESIQWWMTTLGEYEAPMDEQVEAFHSMLQRELDWEGPLDDETREAMETRIQLTQEQQLCMSPMTGLHEEMRREFEGGTVVEVPMQDRGTLARRADRAMSHEWYGQACDIMQTAVEQHPDDAVLHYSYGCALGLLAGEHSLEENNLRKARRIGRRGVEHCQQALELDPDLGGVLTEIGTIYMKIAKHQKAEEAFRRAERECPKADEWDHHFDCRGWNLYQMERYEKARECFERALELNPKHVRARGRLVGLLRDLAEWDEAREHEEKLRHLTGRTS